MFFIIVLFILTIINLIPFIFVSLSPWFFFLWVIVSFIFSLLVEALIIYLYLSLCSIKDPKKKFRHFLLRNALQLTLMFEHIKVTTKGKENIPSDNHFVVYANHKSMIDPVIILYEMNKTMTVVGKSTLFKHKFLDRLRQVYGVVSMDRDNDRSAIKSLNLAIDYVKNSYPVLIFPEGGIKTRETEEMVSLRAGAYKIATKSNGMVLPVSIIGSSKINDKKWYKRLKVTVIFHKPITPSEYEGMNTTELGTKVEEIINKAIRDEK